MITKDTVIPLLLKAAPGFQSAWESHLAWWGDGERGSYNDAAAFARYIVNAYAAGDTSEFGAVFATIEAIIKEGDDEARDIAVVGVLEDIQTISSNRPFGPDVFLEWLPPLSRQAWAEIDALWRAGGGSLAGVIRLQGKLSRGEEGVEEDGEGS